MESVVLDRQSAVPLYYQIQQHLLQQIRTGTLRAGALVPSEQQISSSLGVSPMTARQALKSLCNMGLLYSQRGKGTFVSGAKIEKNSRQVLSFSEEMEARGAQARSRVLSFGTIAAGAEVTNALRLSAKEKVVRLRRVRMADNSPVCIECTCLPLRLCPDLVQKFHPRSSLYQVLWERYGIRIHAADEVVEVGLASAKDAKLLRIARRSPVYLITRTSYVHNGQPVEYVKSTYRGDRFKIVNRLTRQEVKGEGGQK